jgi:hypothetical protein
MAAPIVILIIRDNQGQRSYRAFSAVDAERPLDRLTSDVRTREGIDEGMAIRWRNGEGYIIEVHGIVSNLSHGNRGDFVWCAIRPNGGIAHDVSISHSQEGILGQIQQRGEGWHAVSAIHQFIDPV